MTRIENDTLIQVCDMLVKSHGPDIAHDVVIMLLTYSKPILHPRTFAARCADNLAKDEYKRSSRCIMFSEIDGLEI